MSTRIAPVPGEQGAAMTRGVLFVHACPRALSPHVEWAVAQVLERAVSLAWSPQPVAPGTIRAELSWTGEAGTAARIVSSLLSFPNLRLEVTQEPVHGYEGERFCLTPDLGVFRAAIGMHGDILIPEDRLRHVMAQCARTGEDLAAAIEDLLGAEWDAELEPFRWAGEGAPIRYLHRVG